MWVVDRVYPGSRSGKSPCGLPQLDNASNVLHSWPESKFTQERGRDVGVGDSGRTIGIDHGIDKLHRVRQLLGVGQERSRPVGLAIGHI